MLSKPAISGMIESRTTVTVHSKQVLVHTRKSKQHLLEDFTKNMLGTQHLALKPLPFRAQPSHWQQYPESFSGLTWKSLMWSTKSCSESNSKWHWRTEEGMKLMSDDDPDLHHLMSVSYKQLMFIFFSHFCKWTFQCNIQTSLIYAFLKPSKVFDKFFI